MQPEQVAQEIMLGNEDDLNIDYTDWKSASDKNRAEAFDDCLATFIQMKRDPELTDEQNYRRIVMDMQDKFESWLAVWAEQEARMNPNVFGELEAA